jgi:hypothetical protein
MLAPLPAVDLQTRLPESLLAVWLHGHSPQTQAAYRRKASTSVLYCQKPLPETTLADLQAFAYVLTGAEANRYRTLSAVIRRHS